MAQTPTTDADTNAQIARIDALTANGRTNWFGLMAYLAFALVTVLGVQDVDFFDPRRNTDLPLIGVSIPTFSFFIFAPLLGAALYVYLHLTLRKATEALCKAPHRIGADALEDRIRPWLLNDMILRLRGTDADGQPAATPRPLDPFATLSAIALIWLAGPALMALMWVRSWPAHDWALSLTIAAALLVTVFAGLATWTKLRMDLRLTRWRAPRSARRLALVLGALVLLATTLVKTHLDLQRFGVASLFAQADLSGVRLSVLPPDQADPVAARQRYRAEWCARQGIPTDICGSLPTPGTGSDATLAERRGPWCQEQSISKDGPAACRDWFTARDAEFRTEWTDYRKAVIAALPKPDLSGRDLRGADLLGIEAVGISFRGANLQGADLQDANLEGAIMTCDRQLAVAPTVHYSKIRDRENCLLGDPPAGRLGAADLARANLRGARLTDADLSFVDLDGADLRDARMEAANLFEAQMERAILRDAHLEGATLTLTRMERADLRFARMQGADFSSAWMERAQFIGARLQGANLWEAQMRGVDLGSARMEDVNLKFARMRGAVLSWALLKRANWGGTTVGANPARFADLRGGVDLDQSQLSEMVGNAATLLPDAPHGKFDLYIPSCWAADPPGSEHLETIVRQYGTREKHLRDAALGLTCAPGEVPRKTGTPWPVDADPPWGAQGDGESDSDYWQRVEAWAADQPPGEPID